MKFIRRQAHVEMAKKPKHSFFDPNNAEASAIREACMEVSFYIGGFYGGQI